MLKIEVYSDYVCPYCFLAEGPLEAAIAPYRAGKEFEWKHSAPSLEDVFIELMGKARDNFQ